MSCISGIKQMVPEATAHVAASCGVAVHKCDCQRPSTSSVALEAKAHAAHMIQQAYTSLCVGRIFTCSDVEEAAMGASTKGQPMFFVCPHQDPMGVVAAAITISRAVVDDSVYEVCRLGAQTRRRLAVVLLIAYKMKSDDAAWVRGMELDVLRRFYHVDELPTHWDTEGLAQEQRAMARLEGVYVSEFSIFRLSECNVQSAFEHHLTSLLSKGVLTGQHTIVMMAAVQFYIHAAAVNTQSDVMAELGKTRSTSDLGLVLLLVVWVSIQLVSTCGLRADDILDRRIVVSDMASTMEACMHIVTNASRVSKTYGTRSGPYNDPTCRIYEYVSPRILGNLASAFAMLLARCSDCV